MYVLTLLATALQTVAQCVESLFLLAAWTGGALYTAGAWLVSGVLATVGQVVVFLRILYEDNAWIATEQLPGLARTLLLGLRDCLAVPADTLTAAGLLAAETAAGIGHVCVAAGGWVVDTLAAIENLLIFTGESAWLAATFIPVRLPRLVAEVSTRAAEAGASLAARGLDRALKWSMTTVAGHAIVVGMVYWCWRRRVDIWEESVGALWCVRRMVLVWWHWLWSPAWSVEVGGAGRRAGGGGGEARGEAACVVCRERHKCVLTLPCRHVCLCWECCDQLYKYRRACPMCRTFIYRSIDVYI